MARDAYCVVSDCCTTKVVPSPVRGGVLMTKQELHDFFDERFIANSAGAAYGFSHGELKVNDPDRPITEQESRIYHIAITTSFVDVLAHLGLVDE